MSGPPVNSVNGKQGWVNLDASDIPATPDRLYMTPTERQQLTKVEFETRTLFQHSVNANIHLSVEQVKDIEKSAEHREDDGVHLTSEQKERLLKLKQGMGRRGPPGPAGASGVMGATGGGASAHTDLTDMPDIKAINEDHDPRYPTRTEWDQNGFPDAGDVEITWSDAGPDRTFTISPKAPATSYDYYIRGIKYTQVADLTIQIGTGIAGNSGLWVIYMSSEATLSIAQNPSEHEIDDVIEFTAIIAYVYWNNTTSSGRLMYELHGMNMSPATHHWIHDNIGAVYKEGIALDSFDDVDGNGDQDRDVQFRINEGEIYDEDIELELPVVNVGDNFGLWYLVGAAPGVWTWDATVFPGKPAVAGDNRLTYNDPILGIQVEINNKQFGLVHVFATNITSGSNEDAEFILIQGQADYAKKKDAREGAENEINTLIFGSLPLQEVVPIATILLQTDNGYANGIKSRIVTTDAGDDYVDWRGSTLKATGGSVADHGALAGLSDDDHTQYSRTDGTRVIDLANSSLTVEQVDISGFNTFVAELVFMDAGLNNTGSIRSSMYIRGKAGDATATLFLSHPSVIDGAFNIQYFLATNIVAFGGTVAKFTFNADIDVTGDIIVSGAVDGIADLNGNVTANNAKLTNATHTGEVTGSGALTADKTIISNQTNVNDASDVAVGDFLLIGDLSDSNNLKKATIQSVLNLAGVDASLDVGAIIWWPGKIGTIPVKYLICDGTNTYLQTGVGSYPELFAVVAEDFGSSSPGTTFAVPNLITKFVQGKATLPGTTGGAATHLHCLPAHGHGDNFTAETCLAKSGCIACFCEVNIASGSKKIAIYNTCNSCHVHGAVIEGTVTNAPADNVDSRSSLPPYMELIPLIRAVV